MPTFYITFHQPIHYHLSNAYIGVEGGDGWDPQIKVASKSFIKTEQWPNGI